MIAERLDIDVSTNDKPKYMNLIFEKMVAYGYYDDDNIFISIATLGIFVIIYYLRVVIMLIFILPVNKYLQAKRSLKLNTERINTKQSYFDRVYDSEYKKLVLG